MPFGRPLDSSTLRHIAAPCRYHAPSLRLVQTATCFPNSVERCPALVHTESALCSVHLTALMAARDARLTNPPAVALRCASSISTYACRPRDLNKACVDIAPPRRSKKHGTLPINGPPLSMVSKVRLVMTQPRLTIIQAPMTPGGLRHP